MSHELEGGRPQNGGDQQEGNQQIETAEEWQSRFEENVSWARREYTAAAENYVERCMSVNIEDKVLLQAVQMQEDRTKDWDDWFEKKVRNPLWPYKVGDRTVYGKPPYMRLEHERQEGDRLERKCDGADSEVGVQISQELQEQLMIHEGEEPRTDKGQQEGNQREETGEEREARWEENVALVTREITAQVNRFGEESFYRRYFAQIVEMYAKMMQADKTKDWNSFFEKGFRMKSVLELIFESFNERREAGVEVRSRANDDFQMEQNSTENGGVVEKKEEKGEERTIIG